MSHPQKCQPHYCVFDSPACPETCNNQCQRIKPNAVSVTAQEALNIPELKISRNKTGLPIIGISTRERVFGIPYDPRKDFNVTLPEGYLENYLEKNYDSLHDKTLKEYVIGTCCQAECKCTMGSRCMCRKGAKVCEDKKKDPNATH